MGAVRIGRKPFDALKNLSDLSERCGADNVPGDGRGVTELSVVVGDSDLKQSCAAPVGGVVEDYGCSVAVGVFVFELDSVGE
jgi:hypothetical protein